MKYIINLFNNITKTFLEPISIFILYFFSLCSLNSTICYYYQEAPDFLFDYIPFIETLMTPRSIEYIISDRSLFLYFIIIELIKKPFIKISRLLKFNFIFIILSEIILMFIVLLWELFLNKNIEIGDDLDYETDSIVDNIFYSFVWLTYFCIYLYAVYCAINKRYPQKLFLKKVSSSINYIIDLKAKNKKNKN